MTIAANTNPNPTISSTAGGAGFVTLNPPLACIVELADEEQVNGFVCALAPDLIQTTLSPSQPPSQGSRCQLKLSLASGRHYQFEGQLKTAKGGDSNAPAMISLESPIARAQLTDLLHLIRKEQHIHICATQDVEASDRYTGFGDLRLVPKALPELSWHELDTQTRFLGQRFSYPIVITGMTGGVERAAEINRRLALAASKFGIAMGVGSQRLALENPEHAAIFAVKRTTPDLFLIGNLGFAQLRGRTLSAAIDDCKRAVAMIDADALAIHVNVLQEVIQVEGDRDFRGAYAMLTAIARHLPVPLIVKEVGSGIDPESAQRLVECGVAAIDIGGKGGTSWSFIEGARAQSTALQHVAQSFRDWGIPTAIALHHARTALGPKTPLIATGGVRDGLTIAKAVALGANLVGVGLPLFRAALLDESLVQDVLDELIRGLKTAMIASGSGSLSDLAGRLRLSRRFLDEAEAYRPL